ncbi:MAG: cytochrome c3 family protein, partial [Lysobacteraceae bacterium]
ACHRTTAWLPATFNHSNVTAGSCATCHNGSTATGKPSNHLPTTQSCDACHRTTAWLPATFSHSNVTAGSCATCHNGTSATGKPSNHFVTTKSCDACHRTTAWQPTTTYSHVSAGYRQHQAGMSCTSCHKTNNEVITWQFASYRPNCAGCHANNYKAGEHKKVDTPKILYTVQELQDCSGACHEYTDATFSTIKRTRTGKHRATDGSFD